MTNKKQYRLLMIDDDASLNKLLVEYFDRFGHKLTTATTARDGRYLLRRDDPDLLILDVMMPGLDGFEVCRRMKDDPKLRQIPVLLLSARGREHDRERGMALGAAEYMTKPYSPTDLMQRIRGLLEPSTVGEKK